MSSLTGSLSIALRALMAQQGALETTTNNIANANTVGFSRQRPVLSENILPGSQLLAGNGVSLEQVETIRDRLVELRIQEENQQDGELEGFLAAMHQVETIFNETQGTGIESEISAFFNSLQRLSTDPSNTSLRQGVITTANTMAEAFRNSATNLLRVQTGLDRSVQQAVQQVNGLTTEIATLNARISAVGESGGDTGALVDQRNLRINDLARLIDISVVEADSGNVTLTTRSGGALVVGAESFALETKVDPTSGLVHVFAQDGDITGAIQGGVLGGSLNVRDEVIPAVLVDLDKLAYGVATAFNTVHQAGSDLSGAPGGDFFVPPSLISGAASAFAVALTDPAKFAASSDGSVGDNGNLVQLLALRSRGIADGKSPLDAYANLVFRIGNDLATASAKQESQALILQQLQNQRSAISGVSLDEEAADLLRYQRAFEASARVVAVINELIETAVNLGRS